MGTVEGSTTAGISSTVDGETTTTNGEGSTTPAGETTPDPCTDKDGEEFCLTKIDKCDKQNIIERCEKTCGQCPTTVPVSTTIEGPDSSDGSTVTAGSAPTTEGPGDPTDASSEKTSTVGRESTTSGGPDSSDGSTVSTGSAPTTEGPESSDGSTVTAGSAATT